MYHRVFILQLFQNLLPFGNGQKRPKPSYGPPKPGNSSKGKPSYKPKPSYGPPKGREKPSYKPKPSYGPPKARRPSYKPQGGNGGGRKPSYRPSSSGGSGSYQNSVTNLQPPSPTSSHQGPGGSSITDYEMKELLVSIHNMMEQIVANTQANSAPDSYGNPLAPPTTGSSQGPSSTGAGRGTSAPDSYGNPLAPPTSGSSQGPSSTGAGQGTAAPDSYGNPLGSPIRSRPASSSPVSSSDSYGLAQAAVIDTQTLGSYSSTGQDPVIRSTLEQISKALRQYRDTETGIDERSLQDGKSSVPRSVPSFNVLQE